MVFKKFFRKFVSTAMVTTAAAAITVPSVFAADFNGFSDVQSSDDHYEAINALAEQGIITGYEDDTFRQWRNVDRRHAAVMLYEAMGVDAPADLDDALGSYNDIDSKSLYAKQIAAVTNTGVFKGNDGKFNPDGDLTREQMATVLVLALDLDEYNTEQDVTINLDNVSTSHKENVQILANLGATNQLDNFRPQESISRGAFATFLYLAQKTIDDAEGIEVQLLGINDLHGQIDVTRTVGDKEVGGAAYLAAYLKKAESENENTLLVHAGDVVGASSPTSALSQDEPTIEILNELGFDVGTLGNHEFDEGVAELKRLIDGGYHEETGDFEGASFPYVSANVVDKATGETILPPYVIKDVGDAKIGFIGVITQETRSIVIPDAIKDVEFTDPTEAIDKAVDELKEKGVKSIVVLAHNPVVSNQDGTGASGEAVDIANSVDDEVDIIFAGHNHSYANTTIDNKLIVQAYSYGTAFSDVDIVIDPETDDIVKKSADVITTYHDGIEPDPTVQQMVDTYKEEVKSSIERKVGVASEPIKRDADPSGESSLGNIIADSQRQALETDFAFMNPGGIRASLNEGDITWGELYTIQPFGNILDKMTFTGEQIKAVLEQQFSESGNNILLQISGLHYTWSKDAPIGNKVKNLTDENGTPIDPDKEYTVALNDFLATGGDGFTKFKDGTDKVVGPVDLDAIVNYIEELSGPIAALKTNRIDVE